MDSAPSGFTTPKTNWASADVVTPTDMNRIEGNINAVETGSRTIDPAQVPSGLAGTLRQFLDWFANRIKAITGKANWYDAPDTTLAAAKAHMDAAAPHSGHETPAGAQAKVDTHAASKQTHGASSSYYLAKTSRSDQLPAWGDIPDKPANFTPSAHKNTHATGGADALAPADIGAVNKAGDTMTGMLTVPNLKAQMNIPSSSPPSAWPVGFVVGIVYNNGYPVSYGTIFSYKGTSGNSCVQILQAWPNTDGGEAYLYVRSSRDTGTDVFGPWRKVWSENNDGAGSGLDADTVDGYSPSTSASANTLALRDANGAANFSPVMSHGHKITVSSSAPSSPVAGDIWIQI